MTILNLLNPSKSVNCNFKITEFSDTQRLLTITDYSDLSSVKIIARLCSWRDLELIIIAHQAICESVPSAKVDLIISYFLGARSDRKFQEGSVNYLKTVICPIINLQKFNTVSVFDPHSDVLEACLNNFVKITNFNFIKLVYTELSSDYSNIILVSPDGGSLKKIYDLSAYLNISQVVCANKHRDALTGQIISTQIDLSNLENIDNDTLFLVVDDICDGGRTFIELAKAIRLSYPTADLALAVSHGIFTNGTDTISEYYGDIFTTDSFTNNLKNINLISFNSII